MAAPQRERLQEYHYSYHRSLILEENIVAVITQGSVIEDDLKRQIKTKLRTYILFLLT